jgi:DNA-binding sugar fermentation-stimulating protein
MENHEITRATFIIRENRFLGFVFFEDHFEKAYIKNAKILENLLVTGKTVLVQRTESIRYDRQTRCDIIAVYQSGQMIYLDQNIPKKVVKPFLELHILFPDTLWVKKYCLFGGTHFDYRINNIDGSTVLLNVLPVTMERDGNAIFPDHRSKIYERKVRDIIKAATMGQKTCIMFVITMKYCETLICDFAADNSLFSALFSACELGVKLVAYRVDVEKKNMEIIPIPVPIEPFTKYI